MLQQLSYHCPGLHGPECRQEIQRQTFQNVFDQVGSNRLIIPLFQRRYCWSEALISGWWRDVLQGTRDHLGIHNSGNTVVKRVGQDWMVLDGQQRLTTTTLLIASLRDALLHLSKSLSASGSEVDKAKYSKLLKRLHAVLYLDSSCSSRRNEGQEGKQKQDGYPTTIGEGEDLASARLLPSFSDRQSYFSLITHRGKCQTSAAEKSTMDSSCAPISMEQHVPSQEPGGKYWAATTSSAMTADTNSSACSNHPVSRHHEALDEEKWAPISPQERAKRFFDAQLQVKLEACGARAWERLEMLEEMAHLSLDQMGITWVNVLNEINMAQVFLWLQEKTLFGASSFLYNPSPGMEFTAPDLIRNLMVSSVMNESLSQQESFYHAHWLIPIEQHAKLSSSTEDLATHINRFVTEFWRKPDQPSKPWVSQTEKLLTQMSLKTVINKGQTANVSLYAQFYSLFEYRVGKATEHAKPRGKPGKTLVSHTDVNVLKAVSIQIMAEILDFLDTHEDSEGTIPPRGSKGQVDPGPHREIVSNGLE